MRLSFTHSIKIACTWLQKMFQLLRDETSRPLFPKSWLCHCHLSQLKYTLPAVEIYTTNSRVQSFIWPEAQKSEHSHYAKRYWKKLSARRQRSACEMCFGSPKRIYQRCLDWTSWALSNTKTSKNYAKVKMPSETCLCCAYAILENGRSRFSGLPNPPLPTTEIHQVEEALTQKTLLICYRSYRSHSLSSHFNGQNLKFLTSPLPHVSHVTTGHTLFARTVHRLPWSQYNHVEKFAKNNIRRHRYDCFQSGHGSSHSNERLW